MAVETSGAFGPECQAFFKELGQHLVHATSEPNSHQHLIENVFVVVARGNTMPVIGCLGHDNQELNIFA